MLVAARCWRIASPLAMTSLLLTDRMLLKSRPINLLVLLSSSDTNLYSDLNSEMMFVIDKAVAFPVALSVRCMHEHWLSLERADSRVTTSSNISVSLL